MDHPKLNNRSTILAEFFFRWGTCLCCLGGLAAFAQAEPQETPRPTCAILTFEAKGGEISSSAVEMLSDRFSTEFDRLGMYRMVSRSQMKEILQAQQFSQSEFCSASECAVEAGKLLGVQYIAYGTIGKLGNVISINSFMADVETGEQIRSATSDTRGGIEDALTMLMGANARKLLELSPQEITIPISKSAPDAHVQSQNAPPLPPPANKRPLRPPPEPENFYIGPRVGYSSYSGIYGMECQFLHLGVSAGSLKRSDIDGYAVGAKYYLNKYRSTWYLGVCYNTWTEPFGAGGPNGEETYTGYGIGLGYRWRLGSGWDIAVGLGYGKGKTEKPLVNQGRGYPENFDSEDTTGIGELTVGYSF